MRYKVLLQGEKFTIPMNNVFQKVGFFTTRYVTAYSEQQAKEKAVANLCKEKRVRRMVSQSSHDSKISVSEIEQVTGWDVIFSYKKNNGFTFYMIANEMDEQKTELVIL